MKVNRDDILWFLNNIRRKYPEANDTQLADHLASYIEANPRCIDMEGVSHPGRFSYSTVGYGVFSLLGEKYRMGRIEVFDREDESGYQVHEGIYTMPHMAANQFEDFIESLQTDLPIEIKIGSHEWCADECAKALGFIHFRPFCYLDCHLKFVNRHLRIELSHDSDCNLSVILNLTSHE